LVKKAVANYCNCVFSLRIIGDFILSAFFGYTGYEENLIWKFITTFLIITASVAYFSNLLTLDLKEYKENFAKKFSEDLYTLLLLYIIGLQ